MYKIDYLMGLFFNIIFVICIPLSAIFSIRNFTVGKNNLAKRVNIIMNIIILVALLWVEIFTITEAIDYFRDLPAFVRMDYKVQVGKIDDSYSEAHDKVIIVDGVKLYGGIKHKDRKKYYDYKFYYLPNTHRIMLYSGFK